MSHLCKLLVICLLLPGFASATGLGSSQQQWIEAHLESGDLTGLAIVSIKDDAVEFYSFGQMSADDPRPPERVT